MRTHTPNEILEIKKKCFVLKIPGKVYIFQNLENYTVNGKKIQSIFKVQVSQQSLLTFEVSSFVTT